MIITEQAAKVLAEIDEQLASEELESCGQCEGASCISYNPNLNPNAFPATATAKCNHCNGTGKTSDRTVCPKSPRILRDFITDYLDVLQGAEDDGDTDTVRAIERRLAKAFNQWNSKRNHTDDQLKQRDAVSDTPRTETERLGSNIKNQSDSDKEWPWSAIDRGWDFARQLERELAAVTAERDVLRADLCAFAVDMERQLSAVTAERDALKADRETELFQMAGYLSAELPALHSVEAGEIMRAVDAWIKREARDAKLAKEGK